MESGIHDLMPERFGITRRKVPDRKSDPGGSDVWWYGSFLGLWVRFVVGRRGRRSARVRSGGCRWIGLWVCVGPFWWNGSWPGSHARSPRRGRRCVVRRRGLPRCVIPGYVRWIWILGSGSLSRRRPLLPVLHRAPLPRLPLPPPRRPASHLCRRLTGVGARCPVTWSRVWRLRCGGCVGLAGRRRAGGTLNCARRCGCCCGCRWAGSCRIT